MDDRLKNRLWSACAMSFWADLRLHLSDDEYARIVFGTLQDQFFGKPIDSLRPYTHECIVEVRNWYRRAAWNEVYDFIEFLASFKNHSGSGTSFSEIRRSAEDFISIVNQVLIEEKSAYRFVAAEICEITDELEIVQIEDTLSLASKFIGVKAHIQNGIKLYASRDRPDYRNSIKESISAVEAMFAVINKRRSNSMSDAVKLAEENGLNLHPALRKGLLSLYGWTSDEAGIRHSLFEDSGAVTAAQAKFCLVLCAALVNFLIDVSHSA